MTCRNILNFLATIWCSVWIAGCDVDKSTITIGTNPWPGYEFLHLASVKDYFTAEGVRVTLKEYGSLSDARRDFERGNLDGIACSLTELLHIRHNSNRSPEVILVSDYSDGADVIIARNPIMDIAALRGKRVALELASLNEVLLSRALQIAGLSMADIQPVAMDQTAMAKAFADGAIDAVVTYPPVSIEVIKRPDAKIVFSSRDIPGEIVDIVALDASILTHRGTEVSAIMRAWRRAVAYSHENQGDAYRIMAARESITAEEFGQALNAGIRVIDLPEMPRYFGASGLIAQSLKHVNTVLRAGGIISGPDLSTCCSSLAAPLIDDALKNR